MIKYISSPFCNALIVSSKPVTSNGRIWVSTRDNSIIASLLSESVKVKSDSARLSTVLVCHGYDFP